MLVILNTCIKCPVHFGVGIYHLAGKSLCKVKWWREWIDVYV